MAARQQTSILVSPQAFATLLTVAKRRAISRDEAVRQLLRAHVLEQGAAEPEQRLSHISTVLRYPPSPPHRSAKDGRVRLAARLDAGMAAKAAEMSLRLPGQPVARGHRDYARRALTDAIATSIARVEPYLDEGLEELPPLLSHREALGLWRLTVAATLTRAEEQELLVDATAPVSTVLLEEDVAWHDPWRFEVARHLAHELLAGEKASKGRELLREQGLKFERLQRDLERHTDDGPVLAGVPAPQYSLQGRGGAAVWRAKRKLALESVAKWIVLGADGDAVVAPPDWHVRLPVSWAGHRFRHGDTLADRLRADVGEGRVLRIDHGSRSVLWPYDVAGVPVPGFAAVVRAADGMAAAELVELVLLSVDETGIHPAVPAEVACDLGLIEPDHRDRLLTSARDWNAHEVRVVLERARRLDPESLTELQAAAGEPERFALIARRAGLRCRILEPSWRWEIASIAEALMQEQSAERLRYLTVASRGIRQRLLEASMRDASARTFDLGAPAPDLIV